MKPLPRYTSRLFGKPLAVAPIELQELMQYVSERTASATRLPRARAAKGGLQSARTGAYMTADGVCVIPVLGTLVHRSSWLDAECGMRSYAALAEDIETAMEASCRGVLMSFDSPGGECAGLFTLADKLQALAAAKPVFGVVDDMACSAAYLLAAHCERLYISESAAVGSIGVIAQHLDQSGWDEQNGLRYTAIFAGARKNDGTPHEALSDPALQSLQTEVDRIYGLFVNRVAVQRGLGEEAVRAQEARWYTAQAAIDAGLADEFGSPEMAMQALLERLSGTSPTSATRAAARSSKEQMMKTITPAASQSGAAKPGATMPEEKDMAEDKKEPKAECTEDEQAQGNQEQTKAAVPPVSSQAAAEEISALCSMAGKPELAAQYILQRATVAQVRKDLMAAISTNHNVTSAITASTGVATKFNAFDPQSNPLLADAQRRAAAMKKEGR